MIKLAFALTLIALPAMAQNWTSSTLGNQTYYNSNDGWRGQSSTLGNQTYSNFTGPNGQSTRCTSSRLGNQTYTNCQ